MLMGWGFGLERPEYIWLLLLALPLAAMMWGTKRRLSRGRLVGAYLLRLAVLVALSLAAAGLTLEQQVDDLAVVFAIDGSASVGVAGQQKAAEFVQEALKHQQEGDLAGVVVFGGDAALDQAPRPHLEFHGVESVINTHQSDLAAGLRLSSAVLPSNRARRIVLLSDGEETRGDAATQVMLTAGDDLEIGVVPIAGVRGQEVVVEDLIAPARVDEGAGYEIRVVVRSDQPAKGKLRIFRDETYLGEIPVDLIGGRAQVIPIRQESSESGLYRYRAELEVDGATDTLTQNNEGVGTVQVTGKPRVLYAEGYPDQAKHLRTALEGEGFKVDVVTAADIPQGPSGLRPYAAVILSDIPAYNLTTRQQEAIHAYVRDLGRGLVMIGGDQSFGVGGYYETPIEDALPVRMDIQDKSRFPKMAMVHAIDKSCSMGEGNGSPLGLAKEAAIKTVELLSERDQLGVIGFDDTASWIVKLQPLTDKPGITQLIASVRGGGGTDIMPAVQRANQAMDNSDASIKHLIIMSDGVTAPGDFQGVISAANKRGITTTALAIGDGADRVTMQSLAQWGGGHYYLVTDPTAIPAIFTRETLLASRSFLIEEDFTPVTKEPSELVKGITGDGMAPLHGFVTTEPKKRATVALEVPGEHPAPLLAHWHYGLGRSVAWTSDSKARWSSDWLGTDDYSRLWAQTVRWVVGDPYGGNLSVETEIRDGELQVTVDAFDPSGGFQNFLAGEARVVAPDLSVRSLDLQQVAPGRYRASLPVDQDGSWLVGVAMKKGDELIGQTVAEAVQPYSPEFRVGGAGRGTLEEIGKVGGGGTFADAASVFARPLVARSVPHPLFPIALAVAAFLLLLDITMRRFEWFSGRGPALLSTVRTAAAASRPIPQAANPSFAMPALPSFSAAPGPSEAPVEATTPEVVVDPETVAAAKGPDAGSYAGRLLAARKTARKKMGDE